MGILSGLLAALLIIGALLPTFEAFVPGHCSAMRSLTSQRLMASRITNKEEKRIRNRAYAKQFDSWAAHARRAKIIEDKKMRVAQSKEDYINQVYVFTTDEDMPFYDLEDYPE